MEARGGESKQAEHAFGTARVLLLGVGGIHGKDYKLGIVKKLRQVVAKLVVVEAEGHWADDCLRSEIGVDGTILLPDEYSPAQKSTAVIEQLETSAFSPDAVITYRQEWLALRAHLAEALKLPGPSKSSVEIAGDKFKTKSLLKTLGLEVPAFELLSYEALQRQEPCVAYPVFIRPATGIRSEWARAISNRDDFRAYATDVNRSGLFAGAENFLVESLLAGHEVDADLFLHEGQAVYGKASDNFPGRFPFALETGHLMPSILPDEVQDKLVDAASRAALACGFRAGNLHAELMVLPDRRVFVVEVNGRLGGMYIADWHRRIWGVDLILAELAVALGESPGEFLRVEEPGLALAQVCLCAPPPREKATTSRSVFFDPAKCAADIGQDALLESWYHESQTETLPVSGPLNLGALTVSSRNALNAFEALVETAYRHPVQIAVDGGLEAADLSVLNQFCASSPVHRYSVRRFTSSDSTQFKRLMQVLTPHAGFDLEDRSAIEVDPSTIVLCAADELRPGLGIVGTISIHFWNRIRPRSALCAYLHDLVVLPEYRKLGIAHQLFDAAVELVKEKKCYKAHLDCDETLRGFYAAYGFTVAGDCMVRYFS